MLPASAVTVGCIMHLLSAHRPQAISPHARKVKRCAKCRGRRPGSDEGETKRSRAGGIPASAEGRGTGIDLDRAYHGETSGGQCRWKNSRRASIGEAAAVDEVRGDAERAATTGGPQPARWSGRKNRLRFAFHPKPGRRTPRGRSTSRRLVATKETACTVRRRPSLFTFPALTRTPDREPSQAAPGAAAAPVSGAASIPSPAPYRTPHAKPPPRHRCRHRGRS